MVRDFAYNVLTFLGRWLLGYAPFPEAIEERAIAETLAYLDGLILERNPNAWADADKFLMEQLETAGGAIHRHGYLLKVLRDRFDPAVLVSKLVG